jgi:hypothetical protein
MKISDIPNSALSAQPTPIPMKVVYDWDVLHDVLLKEGFVIIESDNNRTTKAGAIECVPVKAFTSHLRTTNKLRLQTKRISSNRWFCTL